METTMIAKDDQQGGVMRGELMIEDDDDGQLR